MDVSRIFEICEKKIFDVGAGVGRMVKFYIDFVDKVLATDIFQNQIDFMKRRFFAYDCFSAELIDILEANLSEYKGGFDTVICINVLEHLSDDYLAVKKMSSLLEEGGKLF